MFNKNKTSGHNSWKSYTDLITGLLMVFILISIFAFSKINNLIGETQATKKQYEMIKKIDSTFRNLKDNSLFKYNPICNQFELAVDIQFAEGFGTIITEEYRENLENAGKELSILLDTLNEKFNVRFSVIIEGRAAKHLNYSTQEENDAANDSEWDKAMIKSYERAYELKKLWYLKNIMNWSNNYADISIAGSGFGGKCRYPYLPGQEEKNKRFIIKVIPRFSPDFFEITN